MRYIDLSWTSKAATGMEQVIMRGNSADQMTVLATLDNDASTYRDKLTTDTNERVLYYKIGTKLDDVIVYSDAINITVPADSGSV